MPDSLVQRAGLEALPDEEVVARVLNGEVALFEILMRRYNQRLYRAARAILGSDSEAEDVMQEAYVRAYVHLDQFAGRAKFSTWLTRIAVHEALARHQRAGRYGTVNSSAEWDRDPMSTLPSKEPDPERRAFDRELQGILENAVDSLPEIYRTVFMLREVEEMGTAETGEALGISEETVKVRLHRARAMLRRGLFTRAGISGPSAFQFEAPRCDRVVAAVFARLPELPPGRSR